MPNTKPDLSNVESCFTGKYYKLSLKIQKTAQLRAVFIGLISYFKDTKSVAAYAAFLAREGSESPP